MKRALIHIGTSKTGTTSLQKAFKISTDLELNDIHYPFVDGFYNYSNQNYLSLLYKEFKNIPRGFKTKYQSNEEKFIIDRNELKQKFLAALVEKNNILISAEYLSNYSVDEIRSFKQDLIDSGFYEVLIVVFVRDPVLFYVSSLQQRIKASYIFEHPNTFKYNFKHYVIRWKDQFDDNIKVIKYDKSLASNNGLLTCFESVMKNFFKVESLNLINAERENSSLSLESLQILINYRFQHYKNEDNVFKYDSNTLISVLSEIENGNYTKLELKQKWATQIRENHSTELNWLKEKFGIDFKNDTLSAPSDKGEWDGVTLLIKELFDNYDETKVYSLYNELLQYLLNKSVQK